MPKYPSHRLTEEQLAAIPEIEWARLAMAIDGEGSICILRCWKKTVKDGYPYSIRHFLHVAIMNTDLRLLRWCRDMFGGGVYDTATGSGQFKKRRDCYSWSVSSGYAEKIVRGCLRYFIIKKDQAELALVFQETFKGTKREKLGPGGPPSRWIGSQHRLLPHIVEKREELKLALSELKRVVVQ